MYVDVVILNAFNLNKKKIFFLFFCHYRLIESFNSGLEKVALWTKVNMLSLNVNKTFAMLFTNRELGDSLNDMLFFDGEQVQFNTSGKFLGLIIDSGLNYITTF